ncbi:hypothetical protein HNR23_003503 [Nocardiopsis mwathae]|uniref:DUF4245 domain-containing protein n=1 Tax=Nocardiopsis mwathae TaxID=1472723 RepID=A0A7W9YJR9_9ACTN|nr:DUF4245 domain-containing protein [Nocardiopsis mwathae]MBB6173443.1 hypothetical protein [Nocardiopsis mwathae]
MSSYDRANSTFGSLVIAMGIIVGILLVMALVVAGRREEHIPSVDYRLDAAELRDTAAYTTYVPGESLPDGWVATSTNLDTDGPVSWSLGFATPGDRHAELAMSDADPDDFIAETTRQGEPNGSSEVGGESWERFEREADPDEKPRRALVKREEGATVIVAGSASFDELETLADSLDPQT